MQRDPERDAAPSTSLVLSLATFNVLADCYSHNWAGGSDFIQWSQRKDRINAALLQCEADILCLQEVDHYEDFYVGVLKELGYEAKYLQRPTRSDGCVIAWKAMEYECLQQLMMDLDKVSSNHSWRKHNVALACLLRHKASARTFIVCTTHLYWNPRRPDVKFAQAQWVADSLFAWEHADGGTQPCVLAGDFNTLPDSDVYALLTGRPIPEHGDIRDIQHVREKKFLCDVNLNRFCRWLRVCGIDTALETEEEAWARNEQKVFALFERCRREGRILLTSSKTLTQRRECPQCYLIDPKRLEVSFAALCQQAHVRLEKNRFLTVCVKCNGVIVNSTYEEATASGIEVPPNIEIYLCSQCHQPYWWSERENSSAVRAKQLADHLYDLATTPTIRNEATKGVENEGNASRDADDDQSSGGTDNKETESTKVDVITASDVSHSPQSDPNRMFKSILEEANGTEPLYTNWTNTFLGTLDYIFVSRQWRSENARIIPGAALIPTVTQASAQPDQSDALAAELTVDLRQLDIAADAGRDVGDAFHKSIAGPFPSKHWPSDHTMLIANLIWD